MIGYRGNASWRDMSEYVVHFSGSADTLLAIMRSDRLEARTSFGWAREYETERQAAISSGASPRDYPTQKSVCLSEIPLDLLDRLVGTRGEWGLGFTKTSIEIDGAARVWYVEMDTQVASALGRLQAAVDAAASPAAAERKAFYALARYVDKLGDYPNGQTYRFEWEREWRVPNGLDLGSGCPAFLFAPSLEHASIREELARLDTAGCRNGVPPLLDLSWDETALQQALDDNGL